MRARVVENPGIRARHETLDPLIKSILKSAKTLLLLALAPAVYGAVKLPALISDHMVLQQGMPVRIWGSADPGESVTIEFQGQTVSAKHADGLQQKGAASITGFTVAGADSNFVPAAFHGINALKWPRKRREMRARRIRTGSTVRTRVAVERIEFSVEIKLPKRY